MKASHHIWNQSGKYIYCICLLLSFVLSQRVFAGTDNDCHIIEEIGAKQIIFADTLPKKAKKNLALACKHDKSVLQSTYILDHLIDVMRRNLDGDSSLQYAGIPTKDSLDVAGKERRDYINKTMNNIQGVVPLHVRQTWSMYRGMEKASVWGGSHDIVCGRITPTLSTNRNISDPASPGYIPLTHKYLASCAIARCSTQDSRAGQKNPNDLTYCQLKAEQRIQQEKDLVQLTLIEQGSRSMLVHFDSYAIQSFTQSGLNPLLENITQFASLMRVIYKSAGGATRQCSG